MLPNQFNAFKFLENLALHIYIVISLVALISIFCKFYNRKGYLNYAVVLPWPIWWLPLSDSKGYVYVLKTFLLAFTGVKLFEE